MADQLIETEGYFVRAYYDDGDVTDSTSYHKTGGKIRAEVGCRNEARSVSRRLRATVSACKGAEVLAEYRKGKEV